MTLQQTKTINVDLPLVTYNKLKKVANKKKQSVEDVLLSLVDRVITKLPKIDDIPMVDEKTEKRIAKVYEEYRKGDYIEFDPHNEDELRKALPID